MFKSLRTLAFATLLPFALPTLAQVNATLPANVQKALQTNKLTGNDLSLVLIPLDGPGNPTYYNADVSVNPASTMKLFTTYAALEMLGPTYQWKTEFYTDGQLKNGVLNGNLYLKGGGDPKLNMEKLWLLMRDLRANGVTKVTGDLVLDRSYFNIPQLPVFNDDGGDDTKPFLVGPDSLLVNLKSVRMVVRTDGNKVNVQMDPPLANVRIDNQVPRNATLIAKAFSPDLVEIIRDINKYSNNTMARQLFLSIGAQFRNSADGDDAQAAQRVVRQWLARKGITAPRLVMENGSGLSRQERVSAREMAAMLQAAWHSPYAAEYISSLPLAGLDGTMRKRLRRTALVGEAHVKTGTLNTVRALAGFSRDASGHNWVVVAILNSPRPWGASAILDQVLLSLHARK